MKRRSKYFVLNAAIIFALVLLTLFKLIDPIDSREDIGLIRRYWSNGKIKEEYFVIEDSIIQGEKRFYYVDGNLEAVHQYSHGLLNGLSIGYYPDHSIKYEVNYLNGLQNGNNIWYYPNGLISHSTYWIDGKVFGNAYYYHENGIIRTFVAYDFYGKPQYLIKYDTSGSIIREEGAVLNEVLFDCNLDSIPLGLSLNGLISLSIPPLRKVFVELCMYDRNSKITVLDTCSINYNTAKFSYRIKMLGLDSLFFIGKMLDPNDRLLKSDTIVYFINAFDIKAE